ncbi:MAG: DUF4062 domain-containing protein [Rikenellaceae bacterium]
MRERKVRIFLSSTFRDMNAERDYLINIVFPRISAFCKELEVEFIPLDLRWGITEEEQKNGRVITTCLEEVDNSRPFFIGLLGERYGWVPSVNEFRNIPLNTLSNFKWIESDISNGMSITEMEMQYAALRDNAIKHAAFYMRSPKIESTNPDFKEKAGSQEEAKLKALKAKITNQKLYPSMIYESIEQLGEQIYDDVTTMISEEFPPLPWDRDEDYKHKFIMQQRVHSYVEDSESMAAINSWISGGKRTLLISGSPSCGKSSLVCSWAHKIISEQPHANIIYHDYSLNDSNDSEPIYTMAEHINQELTYQFNFEHTHMREAVGCLGVIPKMIYRTFVMLLIAEYRSEMIGRAYKDVHNAVSPQNESKSHFKKLSKLKDKIVYIIIDNIDASDDGFDETLKYIESFPPNVKTIFTATTNSSAAKELETTLKCEVIKEPRFTKEMSLEFAKRYLERHSKRLSDRQYELFLQCKLIDNPSYVQLILNRLISFGSFEQLDDKLSEYASIKSSKMLISKSISEVIEEFEGMSNLNPLEIALVAVAASLHGLTEAEIEKICQFIPMEWSMIRGHIVSLCHYTQRRFVIPSSLYRDYIIELASSRSRDFVLNKMIHYFESMINCKTRSDGSYGPNVHGTFDPALVAKEIDITRRQVESLPNLYLLTAQYKKLHQYISYVLNDKYIKQDDRRLYWDTLKAHGYTSSDINGLSGDNLKPSFKEISKFYENYFCLAVEDGDIVDIDTFACKDNAQFSVAIMNIRGLVVWYNKKNYKMFFMAYKNEAIFDGKATECLANHYAMLVNMNLGKKEEAINIALKNIEVAKQYNLPINSQVFVAAKFAQACLRYKETAHYNRAIELLERVYDFQTSKGLHLPLTYETLEALGRLLIHNKLYKKAEPIMENARKSADICYEKYGFKSYLSHFYSAYIQYKCANYDKSIELFNICIDIMTKFNIKNNYDFINSHLFLGYSYFYLGDTKKSLETLTIIDNLIKAAPDTYASLKSGADNFRAKLAGTKSE